jgi:hypothetical protein
MFIRLALADNLIKPHPGGPQDNWPKDDIPSQKCPSESFWKEFNDIYGGDRPPPKYNENHYYGRAVSRFSQVRWPEDADERDGVIEQALQQASKPDSLEFLSPPKQIPPQYHKRKLRMDETDPDIKLDIQPT